MTNLQQQNSERETKRISVSPSPIGPQKLVLDPAAASVGVKERKTFSWSNFSYTTRMTLSFAFIAAMTAYLRHLRRARCENYLSLCHHSTARA